MSEYIVMAWQSGGEGRGGTLNPVSLRFGVDSENSLHDGASSVPACYLVNRQRRSACSFTNSLDWQKE